MGVVNVTPDSFFDGGRYFDGDAAVAHGLELVAEGAAVLDVGGESTRPGADPVPEDEELRRVVPVVRALAPHCRVSIDTTQAAVAEAAVEAGASLVNDLSGTLAPVAARHGVGYVVTHRRGTPKTMLEEAVYSDVAAEVEAWLVAAANRAREIGVAEVYVDPGIGFAKHAAQSYAVLAALPSLVATGEQVLVGTSRKSFLAGPSGHPAGAVAPPEERFEGSLATAVYAMACGAAMVRVHDVRPTADGARLVEAALSGVTPVGAP